MIVMGWCINNYYSLEASGDSVLGILCYWSKIQVLKQQILQTKVVFSYTAPFDTFPNNFVQIASQTRMIRHHFYPFQYRLINRHFMDILYCQIEEM